MGIRNPRDKIFFFSFFSFPLLLSLSTPFSAASSLLLLTVDQPPSPSSPSFRPAAAAHRRQRSAVSRDSAAAVSPSTPFAPPLFRPATNWSSSSSFGSRLVDLFRIRVRVLDLRFGAFGLF